MPTPMPPPPELSDNPEHMQHWLRAKAEDDRRSQEEEKTRQEALKLEQRKVEQAILADSLRAGVPPDVLPLLFASLNGNGVCVPFHAHEREQQWARSGAAHMQATSPSPCHHNQAPLPSPGSSTTLPPLVQHLQKAPAGPQRDLCAVNSVLYTSSTPSIASRTGNISTQLPRLHFETAGASQLVGCARAIDAPIQAQKIPSFPSTARTSISRQQQTAAIRDELTSRSSPSISFHHWVPPQVSASASTDSQVPLNRKRKSSYPHHHQVPPPRSLDTPAEADPDDGNGSIRETHGSPRSQRRLGLRDQSSSYESGEGEYPTPAELHASALLDRKELHRREEIKKEQEHEHEQERTSHRDAQDHPLTTLNIEKISSPGGAVYLDRP
ncbi:hypothetical protein N7523_006278 [Penicillium sp. IBT 18751x]|nr:hypothetical protein N7523_006278 [Penicillium sp. IBT 18751x]